MKTDHKANFGAQTSFLSYCYYYRHLFSSNQLYGGCINSIFMELYFSLFDLSIGFPFPFIRLVKTRNTYTVYIMNV